MGNGQSSAVLERGFTFGVSFCYLGAFSSMYCQINGLQSPNGIIPRRSSGTTATALPWYFWPFGARPDLGCDVLCLSGIFLSALGIVDRRARTKVDLTLLWYFYLQMRPEDPPLLNDAGFVALVVAPLTRSRTYTQLARWSSNLGLALGRWLLFVLMFESGVGKVLGGSPAWWNLTAAAEHLVTQPFPSSLGCWLHGKIPPHVNRFLTAFVLFSETIVPILFLYPFQMLPRLRQAAFVSQVMLQTGIQAVGSFGFLNSLTCALSLCLLPTSRPPKGAAVAFLTRCSELVVSLVLLSTGYRISMGRVGPTQAISYIRWAVDAAIALTALEMSAIAGKIVQECGPQGTAPWYFKVSALLDVGAAVLFFTSSCVASTSLIGSILHANPTVDSDSVFYELGNFKQWLVWHWHPALVQVTAALKHQFKLLSGYALFGRMTGAKRRDCASFGLPSNCASNGRAELIIEASVTEKSFGEHTAQVFQEIPFKFKIGNAWNGIVAPHHPILEYQLWLATQRYFHDLVPFPEWLVTLMLGILKNNEEIINLLDRKKFKQRFPKTALPKTIRAVLYVYRHTGNTTTVPERRWERHRIEVLPSLHARDIPRQIAAPPPSFPPGALTRAVLWLRGFLSRPSHTRFVWGSVLVTVLLKWLPYHRQRGQLLLRTRWIVLAALYYLVSREQKSGRSG